MQKKQSNTKEYFNELKLHNWDYAQDFGNGGGQATTIEVRNNESGHIGVFRLLREDKRREIDIKRFQRELSILTNPEYTHPSVIEILEYSKDTQNPWYISRKGLSFKDYWKNIRQNNDPDSIVDKAIQVIKTLSAGLVKLHQKGIVHRDINPKNIVIINGDPVLIDFGISFLMEEARVSPDLVACMIGYDASSFNLENNPTPWIDVFLLSQLLIWMVNKKPEVQGVRHWNHTNYIDNISFEKEKALRALTGKCSLPSTSPNNAKELIQSIDSIFIKQTIKNIESKKDIAGILAVVSTNKNESIARFNDVYEVVLSNIGLFTEIAQQFEKGLLTIKDELKAEGLNASIINTCTAEQFQKDYFRNTKNEFKDDYDSGANYLNISIEAYTLHCRWAYKMYTNGAIGTDWNYRMYLAYMVCDPHDKIGRKKDPNRLLLPRNDGGVDIYDGKLMWLETTIIQNILGSIKVGLLDKDNWKIIST